MMTAQTENPLEDDPGQEENGHNDATPLEEDERVSDFVYGIEEDPPFTQLTVLCLQLFLSVFTGSIVIPLILSDILCMETEFVSISNIISATFLMQGAITILQATFGVRLPIYQGSSFSYIPPSIALMSFYGACSLENGASDKETSEEQRWKQALSEINGGLLVASGIEFLIGVTGLIGFIRRFVGPICIAPVLFLLGISITQVSWKSCQVHWGISLFTATQIIIFSQFLKNTEVPILSFSKEKGIHVVRTRLFLQFSMLLSIMCSWFLCYILTVIGALPDDPSERTYRARTDIGNEVFTNTSWIGFPYPGQVVWPRVTLAGFFGMLAGVIASIVESLGDYSACAAMCDVPSPPDHAVNRGIAVEGLGGMLSCIWGTGTGTASYSSPIAILKITKVTSRRVVQGTGLICVIVGFLQFICSFFATIPAPVLGGTLVVKTGMIVSIGASLLQEVNLNSSRNLFVLGVAMFFGIAMPEYLKQNPNAINTGSPTFDSSATILMETGIFVGFVVGVVLDNLIPGTLEERGLRPINKAEIDDVEIAEDDWARSGQKCYDLPVIMDRIIQTRFAEMIPISPTFRGFRRRQGDSKIEQDQVKSY